MKSLKRVIVSFSVLFIIGTYAHGESLGQAFKPLTDSLKVYMDTHFESDNSPAVKRIMKRGGVIDFYFTQTLGDYAWKPGDVEWFKGLILEHWPDSYRSSKLGSIYIGSNRLQQYITPALTYSGTPTPYEYRHEQGAQSDRCWVRRIGEPTYKRGLSGRVVALWQSHGRYWDEGEGHWAWQRPPLFRTCEDMFTQSFVLQGLIPMLENAGAYVITPRERDTQVDEVICDYDGSFERQPESTVRRLGSYSERGSWSDAGVGFADTKSYYLLDEDPFKLGSVRRASCSERPTASASWQAEFPTKGRYAVYVSYKTLNNSTPCAHYTVHHRGGDAEFVVDQRMGGGTWVYLGTFEFEGSGSVTLDNGTPRGYTLSSGSTVTADAVRFGGGMGKVARGEDEELSGLPAFAEGALYSLQWAGIGSDVTDSDKWRGEYTREFASRGAWVHHMKHERGVPIDLSLGFHSDAGQRQADSTVGTLSIYTLLSERKDRFEDGSSRWTSRTYADYVQSQVVHDLRAQYSDSWNRRGLWDRSYSESRTTDTPAMILELLSHQNWADMRYGLDPAFRFSVSRAVYKGILKYLSESYGVPYTVQPLPVKDLSVSGTGGRVTVQWNARVDSLESTASPTGYILQTRIDDGPWDEGISVRGCSSTVDAPLSDHIYSFRVIAVNDGGRSFPSEVLCYAAPSGSTHRVLIVNNFDRVAAPAWFDSPQYAGFDGSTDNGVPYGEDITFIGQQYEYDRSKPWESNNNPGFGGTILSSSVGQAIPGNTFDLVYIHARALMDAGYEVCSASRDAWCADSLLSAGTLAVDLLCGKQTSTVTGRSDAPVKYQVWPEALRETVRHYTSNGGNVIVSGSHIGSDFNESIYPIKPDPQYSWRASSFTEQVLGYKWLCSHESSGVVRPVRNFRLNLKKSLSAPLHYNTTWGPGNTYCVESADGIGPAGRSSVILRYVDSDRAAAVAHDGSAYKAVSFGFPLEVVYDSEALSKMLNQILYWFE